LKLLGLVPELRAEFVVLGSEPPHQGLESRHVTRQRWFGVHAEVCVRKCGCASGMFTIRDASTG
jgi:hypothetical protein